jgi:hypothetical protein
MPAFDGGDNVFRVFGPGERLGLLVVFGQVSVDGGLMIDDAFEDAPLESALGQNGEGQKPAHPYEFGRPLQFPGRGSLLGGQGSLGDTAANGARGLDRGLFLKLGSCDWIRAKRNLLITGPCGVGKSFLACAMGQKACREDLSVAYHRIPRLFANLALGRGDGRHGKMLRTLSRSNLLILDDWGPETLNADQRRDLLEIVVDRYDRGSILITSQLPVADFHTLIGNATVADAILDRIVHNAYRVELAGESLRKTRAPTLTA